MADEQHIISRADAKAQGLARYFTGKPCPSGHVAERTVTNKNCVVCAYHSAKKWRDKNPEKQRAVTREWMRKWRERVGPEHVRGKMREAYWNDPEWARKYARDAYRQRAKQRAEDKRQWRKANPDRWREIAERSYKKHPEKYAAWRRNRKARKRNAPGTHTAADLKAILIAQKYRCTYCRGNLKRAKRHVDHIKPLARGGSNGPENLQYLCAPCNMSKGAKDPIQFAQELGRLL
jgi:5-methylcytosine-specific restriction endonuclease McrA